MYSKLNPPTPLNHMAKTKELRKVLDFGRNPDHTLTIVESGKQNFNEMAQAAADGCDFKVIHETLRSGSVRLSRKDIETAIPKGAEYRDTTADPTSIIEADNKVKAAAAEVMEAYSKLPADLRQNMTVAQYVKAMENPNFLKGYVNMKEAANPVPLTTEVK